MIKHSVPEVIARRAPALWRLSAVGERRARLLARALRPLMPLALVSSPEAKATGTAEIVAELLGVPVDVHVGLREHVRTTKDFCPTQSEFERAIRTMMFEPGEMVFGTETANAAHARFANAVGEVMATHSANVGIVSHGTVIALYVARAAELDPFALWKRLKLPSSVTLSWPELVPLTMVEEYA